MAYTFPTVDNFKEYFTRDFPYGEDPTTSVLDSDISKAIDQAKFNVNEGLFTSQLEFTTAFLWVTAHYLVVDLRASQQGISGSFSWLTTSKSVGSVSQGFTIPEYILKHPQLSMLSTTQYGAKYLSLIMSRLVGQIFVVAGRTLP